MTHYGTRDSVAFKQLTWRDEKICALFASLLDKLKAAKDADGSSLLDNTLVVMGSGLRTGHHRRNLPILFAGGQPHGVRQGRHLVYTEDETPLGNLWLSMLRYAGCETESFADSSGVLSDIYG